MRGSFSVAERRTERGVPWRRLLVVALGLNLTGAHATADESIPEAPPNASEFVHPGLLHGAEEIAAIRRRIANREEPCLSGFERLAADAHSSFRWKIAGPHRIVVRDAARDAATNRAMAVDARAAYQNALMWLVTRDQRHAEVAQKIVNRWAERLDRIEGRDAPLAAGLNGFLLLNAAELLRYGDAGWEASEALAFERMVRRAIYPSIAKFAPHANGNWDAACIKTMLAVGVFCNDREVFDRGLDYYRHGAGNGRVTHYVIDPSGQTQESGRDQQHVQLGLGCLAEACEVAWHQGVDLYAAHDHRLLAGYEYTARYLLGEDVPFVPHVDVTGKYRHSAISPQGRERVRPIFELAYGHYHGRLGLEASALARVVAQTRPEGGSHFADHPGFGTMWHANP